MLQNTGAKDSVFCYKNVPPSRSKSSRAERNAKNQLAGISLWHTPKLWNHHFFGRCLRWTAVHHRNVLICGFWQRRSLNPSQATQLNPHNLLPTLFWIAILKKWTPCLFLDTSDMLKAACICECSTQNPVYRGFTAHKVCDVYNFDLFSYLTVLKQKCYTWCFLVLVLMVRSSHVG